MKSILNGIVFIDNLLSFLKLILIEEIGPVAMFGYHKH